MSDRGRTPRVLSFPGDSGDQADAGDDLALRRRISAMYEAFPPQSADAAAICTAHVLAAARAQLDVPALQLTPAGGRLRGRLAALPRRRWWVSAAAAAALIVVITRPWQGPATVSVADSVFADSARDVGTGGSRSEGGVASPRGAVTPMDGGDSIRFDLTLPAGARDVALVGDFNGWDENATPMSQRTGKATWSAEVTLGPGRHVYAFVVNGERWLIDPLAPRVPDAGYGPANAVVIDGSQ